MLEAFKDAKGQRGSAGGPFAGDGGERSGDGRRNARGFVLAVAAIGVAFVLGVLVGRANPPLDEVQAADGAGGSQDAGLLALGSPSVTDSPWVDADDEVPSEAPAEGVSPLLDPRNKYTLVAITYTPRNEALAFENYDHLVAKGLPAFPPFATSNGMLVVVVGAAPKESDLADTLSRLQRLSGPNGSGRPYEGAYANPIRKLIPATSGGG